jgi:hypothetical protein
MAELLRECYADSDAVLAHGLTQRNRLGGFPYLSDGPGAESWCWSFRQDRAC